MFPRCPYAIMINILIRREFWVIKNESMLLQQLNTIKSKIKEFQVIILYDRQSHHFDYTYLAEFPSPRLKQNVADNNIFPRIQSEVFIVWEQAYVENEQLFYKIRLRARKEVIIRLTEYLVAKFFTSYEHYLAPIFKNNPTLKWDTLMKIYYRYEQQIEENTHLNDETSWKKFIQWYKTYITNSVLETLIRTKGIAYVEQLSSEKLNALFFQKLNEQLFQDHTFMNDFTNMVNMYMDKWITETGIINLIDENTMEDVAALLGMQENNHRKSSFESIVKDNYYIVFSNIIYQSVLKALSNNEFHYFKGEYSALITANRIKGKVSLMTKEEQVSDELLKILSSQAELTTDILDLISHIYLKDAVTSKDLIEINIDQLLTLRGLQPKLAGNGRRGGFEKEQREQVLDALRVLQHLYVDIEEITVYENNKRVQKAIKGRVFRFYCSEHKEVCSFKDKELTSFYVQIGEIFIDYLSGSGRQVKLLPQKVLTYHPYQRTIEKKMMRYFSWRFRTQARRGDYLQSLKIKTLLRQINFERKSLSPSRFRDRFEKALDQLMDDQLIASWQYDQWDESTVERRNWINDWLEAAIIILPPQSIITYYQPLEKRQVKRKQTPTKKLAVLETVPHDVGLKLKEKRLEKQLTLAQLAKIIDISVSYLSHIERGVKQPSHQIYLKIKDWLLL